MIFRHQSLNLETCIKPPSWALPTGSNTPIKSESYHFFRALVLRHGTPLKRIPSDLPLSSGVSSYAVPTMPRMVCVSSPPRYLRI